DNSCGRRFKWKLGELPYGYDHKYIYSELGYNLKLTDFQAAIGVAQLKKLPGFIKKRRANYKKLYEFFKKYEEYFVLMREDEKTEVSYFGFPIVVKSGAPFTRNEMSEYLEKNKVGTRNVFTGNLLRHPAYVDLRKSFRLVEGMENADAIMNNAFWIGVWPGIDGVRMKYMKMVITKFLKTQGIF
ncbi:DegT/DnrJ/EryC1/StrS family aminotransferase, partial [Patescibacteria group bacterium]|nr:DegT/DnrJ/EryC1/StrS family aminotransferase [Patescibacteria group bacterium]